jgi:hypothetical protein
MLIRGPIPVPIDNQPSVVAKRLKSTTEMMRPDAGLHANQTGRHIGNPGLNLVT